MTAPKSLAHHTVATAVADHKELERLLRRTLKAIDVHVVFPNTEDHKRYLGATNTTLEISDRNRFFYIAGISIEKHDGIRNMRFRRSNGLWVEIDPADYLGKQPFGLDLGVFSNIDPLLVEVHHELSGGEIIMQVHTFGQDCPAIEKGSREDLAFRATGPNLQNAYRLLRARGPSGDEPLDELLELLPAHLPMLRDVR